MPIPFDMLAVMLFIGYYAENPDPAPPGLMHSLAVVLAAALGMFSLAAGLNALVLRLHRRPGRTALETRDLSAKTDLTVRVLSVAVYACALWKSALPWRLARDCGANLGPESFAVQMFGLLPFLLIFFAAWFPMYPSHRLTTPGKWTRWSYLLFKARYNLYMLLVWIPFAFLADWLGDFLVVLPCIFLAAAWAFPYVLARVWGCKPADDPALLATVARLEKTAGAKFSRVYLWEPGGGNNQNAAAVGLARPFRYLFLTPALVRGMNAEELDAVILHELGHVRKRHLLFYLFTSLAGLNSAVLAGAIIPGLNQSERFLIIAGLALFYFRFVFGWLSRNMERQADLFAMEKTGSARPLANALEKLAISAGRIRLAASWHHLGIAERVDYLRLVERRPEVGRRHHAEVKSIMLAGYAAAILCLWAMGAAVYDEYTAPRRGVVEEEPADLLHWRRVMRLLPNNAAAPLELAYRLAGSDGEKSEAENLARRALELADAPEVRDSARKLLGELRE